MHSYYLALVNSEFPEFDIRGQDRIELRQASRNDHVQTNSHSQIRR